MQYIIYFLQAKFYTAESFCFQTKPASGRTDVCFLNILERLLFFFWGVGFKGKKEIKPFKDLFVLLNCVCYFANLTINSHQVSAILDPFTNLLKDLTRPFT